MLCLYHLKKQTLHKAYNFNLENSIHTLRNLYVSKHEYPKEDELPNHYGYE